MFDKDRGRGFRAPSGLVLRNWRMRWRLLALVIIPTVAAISLGAVRIESARSTATEFAQVDQLATLGGDITALVNAMEDERDLTAGFIATNQAGASGEASSLLTALNTQYRVTNTRLAAVQQQATKIGPGFPAVARNDLSSALSQIPALPDLRNLAHSQIPVLPIITNYSDVVSTLLAFDNDIAAGSSSPQLAQTVSSLASLAQMEEQASQQRAILYAAQLQGQFGLGGFEALTTAQSNEASDQATFTTTAAHLSAYVPGSGLSPTLTEVEQFNDTVAGPDIDEAQSIEQDAIINGANGQQPAGGEASTWFSDMSDTLSAIRQVEGDELTSIATQASSLQSGARDSETLTGVIVLTLLLLVLAMTIIMTRSIISPLRRLRADALDVAGRRLPEMVRRLSESEGSIDGVTIEPTGIDSDDEIGEVARAFDRVHREAVRLAGDEALLRANLNAMFVNLSRRSQSLIERQLGIIDSLEQSEADPDRLSSLFRLDHLATRMRRNSENLLVLAGHEAPRKWSQPVPLVDVLRAAVSEIEQYDRIALNVHPGVVVAGRVASDVVHLAAEVLENATAFSPEDTPVQVSGQQVSSGGVLLEIVDNGLGISEHDLAYANWRLESPPVVDVAVSRRMGLFVVGRLAARHGIRVRLQHGNTGGLCALIWLPDTVASAEVAPQTPFTGRFRPATAPMATMPTTTPASTPAAAPAPTPGAAAAPREPARSLAPTNASIGGAGASDREWSASTVASDARLPIFDSVESEWFRRGGKPAAMWTSPADNGFRAAAGTVSPVTGDTTSAGLPRRVPNANLVPGSVGLGAVDGRAVNDGAVANGAVANGAVANGGGDSGATQAPKAAEAARSRMAGFTRGGRAGRAAAAGN